MKDNQHEQLFTELAPEEAAVIEGGKSIYLANIQAIRTNQDPAGNDDVYLKVDGRKVWGIVSMGAGDTKYIGRSINIYGSTTIDLFDADPWPNNDDFIDSFQASTADRQIKVKTLKNKNSAYRLTYWIDP